MSQEPIKRPVLKPGNWPGWLAVAVLWLLGKTPQWLAIALSGPLGKLMSALMKSRRRIAERNVERCFPQLDAEDRQAIVDGCFRSLGRTLFEITWAWSASDRRIRNMGELVGREHLESAKAAGKGVLLITGHITCLEMGPRIIGLEIPGCRGIYRPLKNLPIEWYQNTRRLRYTDGGIKKNDLRTAIRFLRQGGMLWYAPDQDFGPNQTVFAPFFGIPTATLEATVKLVKLTGCTVVPMFPRYDEARRHYTVEFQPALTDFPTGDMVADLGRINMLTETQVRRTPEQYWWIHRRFKTRPPGEAPFYD